MSAECAVCLTALSLPLDPVTGIQHALRTATTGSASVRYLLLLVRRGVSDAGPGCAVRSLGQVLSQPVRVHLDPLVVLLNPFLDAALLLAHLLFFRLLKQDGQTFALGALSGDVLR